MSPRPLLAISAFGSVLVLGATASAQRVLLQVDSPVAGADAVSPVAMGDWDGDGIDDFAIGAARDSTVANLAGAVRVHSGADGSVLAAFYGTNPIDYFGAYVERIPDMDGDGIDELAASALYADNSGTDTGTVFIYGGRHGALLLQIDGPSSLTYFGVPVSPIGDVDGDGTVDLVISQYGIGDQVHIVSGKTGVDLKTLFGTTGEQFGIAACSIVDCDGDGLRDVLVGAKHHLNAQGLPIGAAFVVSSVTGNVLRTHLGAFVGEFHGYGASEVNDLDADGVDDYVVASKFDDALFSGMVRIYSGATGSPLGKVATPDKRTAYGYYVVGVGDVNGDGAGDFAINGSWVDDNKMGRSAAFLISGKTLLQLDRIETVDLGHVPAAGGDFDGDGFDDVAVGIIDKNLDGKVRVYSGDDLWVTATPSRPVGGEMLDFAVREGATGQPVILVLEDVDGSAVFQIVNGQVGQFDATGGYLFSAAVPKGLAGHDMTFKAYAHDASGRLIESAGQGVHFK